MSGSISPDNILAGDDLQQFRERGWVRLRAAFTADAAERMRAFMWERLRSRHGARPDLPSTWQWQATGLNRSAHHPVYRDVASPRMRGAVTQLLGHERWTMPSKWGGFLVDPPNGGAESWRIPTDGWHWDLSPGSSLFVFTLYAPLASHEGGTLLADGSHRLLRRFFAGRAGSGSCSKALKRTFGRSHPWLARLTGATPCSADRQAEFTSTTVDADGIPLRVSEIVGEPGDAVLCDGCIVHVRPTRIGPHPRFLCVKTVS